MSTKQVDKYFEKVKEMSIPQLEKEIHKLYPAFLKSNETAKWKIYICLWSRKSKLNKSFKFTEAQVEQLEKVNQLLIDATTKLLKKTEQLDRQMQAIKAVGDDFLDDYDIEANLTIEFYDEDSILVIDEDENEGQSDYQAMVEVLDETLTMPLRSFYLHDKEITESTETYDERYQDNMLNLNWDIEELSAPQLQHIPYFCYASHALFCHSNHSYSDIIRIKSFRNEIEVHWLNFAENGLASNQNTTDNELNIDDMISEKNVPLSEEDSLRIQAFWKVQGNESSKNA
jgi:hypothetical protein